MPSPTAKGPVSSGCCMTGLENRYDRFASLDSTVGHTHTSSVPTGKTSVRAIYTQLQDFRKGLHDYLTKFAYKNASTGE